MDASYWTNLLRPVFAGRKVIIAGDTVTGLLPTARIIRGLGAEATFILATQGMGDGELPTPADGIYIALPAGDYGDMSVSDAFNAGLDDLANLPTWVVAALDAFDPDRSAMVVGTFMHIHPEVAGRKSLWYRKPEWLALDDKTKIDSIWDDLGIPRAPSVVVPVNRESIIAAIKLIDEGDGVVLSGDAREGVRSGCSRVRWVQYEDELDRALQYLEPFCDFVRVMPFLEGIPCSIHGLVFDDYVAVFRPVEMIILRDTDTREFIYAGAATIWDPLPQDRELMRDIARKAGTGIRRLAGYRGLFTVDGIITRDGFRPNELNPRSGGGVKVLLAGLQGFPLELISQAVAAGIDLDYQPEALEKLIVEAADTHRGGSTQRAFAGNLVGAKATVGPHPLGSIIRVTPNPGTVPIGQSFAPAASDFWRILAGNAGFGNVEPAKSVR